MISRAKKKNTGRVGIKWTGTFTNMDTVNSNKYMKMIIIPQLQHEFKDINNYELIGDINKEGQLVLLGYSNDDNENNDEYLACELTCNLITGRLYGPYVLEKYNKQGELTEFICTILSDNMVESKFLILLPIGHGLSDMYTYVNNKLEHIDMFYHNLDIATIPYKINVRELLSTYTTFIPEYKPIRFVDNDYEHGISITTYLPHSGVKRHEIRTTWGPAKDKNGQFHHYFEFKEDGNLNIIHYQNSIDPKIKTTFSESYMWASGTVNRLIKSTINKYQMPKLPKVKTDTNFDMTRPASYMGDYEVNGFPYAPMTGINLVPFKDEVERTIFIGDNTVFVHYDNGDILNITIGGDHYADPGVPGSGDPYTKSGTLVLTN